MFKSILIYVKPDPIATFDISDTDKLAEICKTCVEAIRSYMAKEMDVDFTFVVDSKKVTVTVTPKKNHTSFGTGWHKVSSLV